MGNLSKSLRKVAASVFIVVITLMFITPLCRAEESEGTITVSILDENGKPAGGNWYLYYGTTHNNYLARRGSVSESFRAPEGYYFLEVEGQAKSSPYFLRYSRTPQYLSQNGSVIFNMQYYGTQEDMLAASGRPPATRILETTAVGLQMDEVFDIHGCDLTRGYAWCEKDQACTRYWTPYCRVIANQTGSESLINAPTPTTRAALTAVAGGEHLFATGNSASALFVISPLLAAGILHLSGIRRRRP